MRTLSQWKQTNPQQGQRPSPTWGQSTHIDHPKYGRLERGAICDRRQFRVKTELTFGIPGKARPVEVVSAGDILPWIVPLNEDMNYIRKQAEHGHKMVTVMLNDMKRFVDLESLEELE